MDEDKGVNGAVDGSIDLTVKNKKKTMSQVNSEALQKCLEEKGGDNTKCKAEVEAFKSSTSSSSPSSSRKPSSPLRLTNSEALQKCLEENKGDQAKCKAEVEAFRSSSSSSSSSSRKPLTPLRLRSGSLTDV